MPLPFRLWRTSLHSLTYCQGSFTPFTFLLDSRHRRSCCLAVRRKGCSGHSFLRFLSVFATGTIGTMLEQGSFLFRYNGDNVFSKLFFFLGTIGTMFWIFTKKLSRLYYTRLQHYTYRFS